MWRELVVPPTRDRGSLGILVFSVARLALCPWPGSCDALGVECRIEVVRGLLGTVVHLAGRLGDVQVADFVETCARAARPLRIDLSELVSIDPVGIEALLPVREMGAVFDGLPEYLHLKIESLARERRAGPPSRS